MAIINNYLIFAVENNTIDRKNEINLTDYCMKLYRLIFVGKAFLLLASIYFINNNITIGLLLKKCGVTCISHHGQPLSNED